MRTNSFPILAILLIAACGEKKESHEAGEQKGQEEELTAFQLENGIGPVKEKVEVGPIDPALAAKGEALFQAKCSMCHKMDTTYVGPSLGEVTARRTPTYIMNMILNPQEMVERHPVAKKLLAERMTLMANQQLTVEEARAVVEYLRTQSKPAAKP
jgi:cytochrome c